MAIVVMGDNRLARDSLAAAIADNFADDLLCLDGMADLLPVVERPPSEAMLILVDHQLGSACEILAGLRPLRLSARVALYGGPGLGGEAMRCLNLGYSGYMPRTMPAAAMVCAIQLMLRGERFVPAITVDRPAPVYRPPSRLPLSPRQSEILSLVATGASNKHIARTLQVEEVTVKSHVKAIFRKLGVHTRTEAARFVLAG